MCRMGIRMFAIHISRIDSLLGGALRGTQLIYIVTSVVHNGHSVFLGTMKMHVLMKPTLSGSSSMQFSVGSESSAVCEKIKSYSSPSITLNSRTAESGIYIQQPENYFTSRIRCRYSHSAGLLFSLRAISIDTGEGNKSCMPGGRAIILMNFHEDQFKLIHKYAFILDNRLRLLMLYS